MKIVLAGFAAGLGVVCAVSWWTTRDADAVLTYEPPALNATHAQSGTFESSTFESRKSWPQVSISPAHNPAESDAASDASFSRYVSTKYRFLRISAALQAVLLKREHVAVAINTARQSAAAEDRESIPQHKAEIARLDRQIASILSPADLGAFEALKDSDVEQFQLEDFAGGASNVAPLSDDDRRAILYTKLAYRQRFRQVLNDSGLLRADLTAAERQYVYADVSRALREFKESFLQEARQYLYNDAQYTLLSNYENGEYNAELDKLKAMVDGRPNEVRSAAE